MVGKVVVLGAGPAGLSAAWKLSERGVAVEVLEAEAYVGGLSHTIRHGDYLFDLGPHRFHTDNPAVLAEIESLVGKMPEKARKTRVFFLGKYYDYPLSASNLLASLPPSLGLLCFVDFLTTWLQQRTHPLPDSSFESWVVNRFGRRLYDVYFGPYTAKVWGRDPAKLSASWAAQRVAVVDLWDLVLRTFNLRRGYNHFQHSPFKPDFFYPLSGVGRIYEAMAERIVENGGKVRLKSPVKRVRWQGGRILSVVAECDGVEQEVEGDAFVSTLPIPAFVKSFAPLLGQDALAAANALAFRAMIYLFLSVNKERISDDHWIYIPESKAIFNRVSEMKNFTPLAAPRGKTSLTVEITCDAGDGIWNLPEDEIYRQSLAGLAEAGLVQPHEVSDHFFARSLHAYPTYDLKFETNLAKLAYDLAGYTNLVVCGRQGLFRYINQDHAIEMGFCAAAEILAGQIGTRVTRVGSEQVYFG